MPEIIVKDRNNNAVGKITLGDYDLNTKAKEGVLHSVITNYLANQRQGTHSTKTKGLVRGGGKKPWRQKHTGRARAGSIRSPLWRGGGIVFGPQPRDYSYKLPKQVKRIALMSALQEKMSNNEVIVLDNLLIEKPKTKEMVTLFKTLDIDNKSVLVVLPEKNDIIMKSTRNIPGASVTRVNDLNTYDVMKYKIILMTKEAAMRLQGMIEQ